MHYVQVQNGEVVNRTRFDGEKPDGWGDDWITHETAQIGWRVLNGELQGPPPGPSRSLDVSDVAAERDRRLALGFSYPFGDARGSHRIGTTEADIKGWSEVSTYAGALLDSGDVTTKIAIVTDTGPCEVTAPEWRAIEIAAAQFRQPLWAKSFALMTSNPIPADYTDDRHWT